MEIALPMAEVKPALALVKVLLPLRLMLKSLKLARPLESVVRVVVPLNVPLPLLRLTATETPLVETLLPNASLTWTVTAGEIVVPAIALAGDCT